MQLRFFIAAGKMICMNPEPHRAGRRADDTLDEAAIQQMYDRVVQWQEAEALAIAEIDRIRRWSRPSRPDVRPNRRFGS